MNKQRRLETLSLLLVAVCSPVFSEEWKAHVQPSLDALVSSCVVVPCSFSHPGGNLPASRLRAIWHLKGDRDQRIYYEDFTRVQDSFKDRTRLLGDLGQNNCTLEIAEIKNHDNGPFCFRVELVKTQDDQNNKEKFSFVDDCVELKMLPDPPAPTLTHPKTAYQGQPYTITCSVPHTCPSHVPQVTWEQKTTAPQITDHNKDIRYGNYEVESILAFIPEEKDDHTEITCKAHFHGGRTSFKTITLYVKRAVNYNYIIIPTAVGVGTAVIFGLVCTLMVKKYKKRISELQNQDGSMWNRLSRMSRRFRSDGSGPSRSDQRRSVWSRFSRRPKEHIVHAPNNVVDFGAGTKDKIDKPRFPSPKSQPKSCNFAEDHDAEDEYMNTADLNIYGNI